VIRGDGDLISSSDDGASFSVVNDGENDVVLSSAITLAELTFDATDFVLTGNTSGYRESTDGVTFTSAQTAASESYNKDTASYDTACTTDINFEKSDLVNAVVRGFVSVDLPTPGELLFAMTSGDGLWTKSGREWSQE
jgi:hypothetical protein